ncbi:hypothetical protein JM16_003537 [Phytophthora kernoviae]|uniref:Uncharacterized protein n=1 Tax=Phytophthora kernoviae TaxID=325452 RepID=A0A8T0M340_9STRA|nr:hypothetical protein JM16_003537 [Phytophthora kernoviae]
MVRVLGTTALSAALLVSNAAADNYFIAAEAPDYNNKAVGSLLESVGSVRAPGEAYAVFDWDNTCMYGDLSYTTAYYQVDNLNLHFAPEDFEMIFSVGYNASSSDSCFINGTNSVIGQDLNGTDVTLATTLNETAADYKVLYDAYIAPTYNLSNGTTATASLDEIKETTEFINFRAKMGFLLYGLGVSDGGDPYSDCAMNVVMRVLPLLLAGMTEDEIKSLVRSSIRWHLAAGIDVYIISASPELYVLEAGSLLGLGYMVPNDNVFGVRFKTDDAGLFTVEYEDDYPITWGPGKATIVTSILKPLHKGSAPVYGSGDSDGDCEMVSTVRDGIVDINNRLQGNSTCIFTFYQKACEYFNTTEPSTNNTYLLQGQDQVIGSWITSGFTTEDGVSYESGVTSNDGCAAYQFLNL